MNKRAALWMAAASAVSALALAGCGGSGGSGSGYGGAASSSAPASSAPASSAPASSQAAAAGLTLKTSNVGGQTIVVDGKGMTVYFYTRDSKGTTASACVGGCATLWPAVTTASGKPALQGVTGTMGTIKTADGKDQVTINGMPIYYYAKDTAAGQASGQGVAGVWYVVGADGSMVQASLMANTGTSGY